MKRLLHILMAIFGLGSALAAAAEDSAAREAPSEAPKAAPKRGGLPLPPLPRPGKVGDTTVLLPTAGAMFPAHGGPAGKLTYLNGQGIVLFGGIGSLVIGEHWGLGVASYSVTSEYSNFVSNVQNDVTFSYGGLLVDTTWGERELIFYNFSTLFGVGGGTATPRVQGASRGRSNFVLAEPEIKININITTDLRIALGGSYRFTAGADNGAILGMGLDGPSMVLEILVGKIVRRN